jgi:hypothetical protein
MASATAASMTGISRWSSVLASQSRVVRACITEYKVAPLRDDWDKTLALREGDFQIYRSWS